MSEINYKLMFDGIGLYSEKNGRSALAVFSHELPEEISFEKAVENTKASFIYTDIDIKLKGAGYAEKFLAGCKILLSDNNANRGIIWIANDSSIVMPISANFSKLTDIFRTPISGTADNGIEIKIKYSAVFNINYADGVLNFNMPSDFSFGEITVGGLNKVYVNLCGENGGKVNIEMDCSGKTLNNIFKCGFEYGFIDGEGETRLISSGIFYKDSVINAAVKFEFGFGVFHGNTMKFLKPVKPILCNFTSLYGDPIYLSPVVDAIGGGGGISFLPRISENISSAPLGRYTVSTANGSEIKLLCGFSGTEYITCKNNSIVEFLPDYPAFSPFYPEKEFSISDFVEPQPKSLLTYRMVTAWVKFYGKYHSQPLESPFFTGGGDVLSLADLYSDFSEGSPAIPILPYKGAKIYNPDNADIITNIVENWANAVQINGFERSILSSERNNCVYNDAQTNTAVRYVVSNGGMSFAATPSGFVGELKNKGFEKISIAFSRNGDLAFDEITNEIRAAFSNSSMFCVIANSDCIGKFQNKFRIDDWSFTLSPGKGGSYDNYANIIIIKSIQGKIYNPENPAACLCGNPNFWTAKESFSKPSHGEQANLANWISNYCGDAVKKYKEGDSYYKTFVEIITNENWKGFIAFNVSLGEANFPDCLKPLLAGLPGDAEIHAHHIGAELIPLRATENGPQNDGFSPFFGLIRYAADGFYGGVMPIEDSSAEYEFKLLEMNVLFGKGTVEKFSSLSQLVMGLFMGLKPSTGGCLYNALLLNGSLQSVNGHSVLMMNSNGGELAFESAPITKVRINGIIVISVNPQEMKFAFDILGTMKTANECEIDVFSYDKLLFSGYKINLSVEKSISGVTEKKFSLDVSEIKFDMTDSKIRENSFCKTFGLIPTTAIIGTAITKGFKAVAVENFKTGTLAENAAGIEFSVNLGGLGSLSNDSELNSKIIFAWDGKNNRFIGIKLPGTSLIDNVIGVTLGEARLMLKDGNLLLYISKVALQLLGMLKLPMNGALNLALTGNEKGIGWYAAYNKKDD